MTETEIIYSYFEALKRNSDKEINKIEKALIKLGLKSKKEIISFLEKSSLDDILANYFKLHKESGHSLIEGM